MVAGIGVGTFAGNNAGNHDNLVSVRVTQFFDRKPIIDRLHRAELRYLRKAGAVVRLTAKRSMRRHKGASSPGKPPHAHVGRLRDLIFFGLDSATNSVVIGPSLLNGSSRKGGQTLPALHEFGGKRFNSRTGRDAVYEPRPYMGPALEATEPKLPFYFQEAYAKG